MNMGLLFLITSVMWVNKISLFADVFPWDEFQLMFWNLHFAYVEEQGRLKQEVEIKSA
jgi:hypothetical protein